MPVCNNTLETEAIDELPLWNGVEFHHFGLLVSAVFGGVAVLLALYLIAQHALHYLSPWEQRHIIRIILLVPVYAVVSFLSYVYYQHAIYYDVLEGCYEAFAISSFFTLLCNYIAPNLHDQKDYFRQLKPKNWFWKFNGLQYISGKSFPLAIRGRWKEAAEYGETYGPFRKPRSGLTWFNIIWTGVFQYCFIRVLFTIVAVIAQVNDVYCEDSLSPAFAHVWVEVFEAVSVTIAMFCLIQFYIQLREDLADRKPFLKILCIKLVIFFSFWQTIVISFLTSASGPLRPTKYVAYQDLKVGIPAVMLCIEMTIFSVMYLFAFPWKPYSIRQSYSDPSSGPSGGYQSTTPRYHGGPFGIKALADAFNPWDIIKAIGRGFRFIAVGYKHREKDISYQPTPTKPHEHGGYEGPLYAGNGKQAIELCASEDKQSSRPIELEDTASLLANPAAMAHGVSGSTMRESEDHDRHFLQPTHTNDSYMTAYAGGGGGGGAASSLGAPSSFLSLQLGDEDTTYHPGFGPGHAPSGPQGNTPGAGPYRGATPSPLHPALRNDEPEVNPNSQWNFFGGAAHLHPQHHHHHNDGDYGRSADRVQRSLSPPPPYGGKS